MCLFAFFGKTFLGRLSTFNTFVRGNNNECLASGLTLLHQHHQYLDPLPNLEDVPSNVYAQKKKPLELSTHTKATFRSRKQTLMANMSSYLTAVLKLVFSMAVFFSIFSL